MKDALPAFAVGFLLFSATVFTHAEPLSPIPEAGLWHSETRILINGEDQLPGIKMECITPQQAAEMVSLDEMKRKIARDVPDCELTVSPADRSRLLINGNCRGQNGFDGDMQGELEIISSHEIRSSFLGHSSFRMIPSTEADIQPHSIQQLEVSRWTSPDCGAVTPHERLSF